MIKTMLKALYKGVGVTAYVLVHGAIILAIHDTLSQWLAITGSIAQYVFIAILILSYLGLLEVAERAWKCRRAVGN